MLPWKHIFFYRTPVSSAQTLMQQHKWVCPTTCVLLRVWCRPRVPADLLTKTLRRRFPVIHTVSVHGDPGTRQLRLDGCWCTLGTWLTDQSVRGIYEQLRQTDQSLLTVEGCRDPLRRWMLFFNGISQKLHRRCDTSVWVVSTPEAMFCFCFQSPSLKLQALESDSGSQSVQENLHLSCESFLHKPPSPSAEDENLVHSVEPGKFPNLVVKASDDECNNKLFNM